MRVEQLGDGDPAVAVVAAIHGDEPCGVHAVERLLADAPSVEEPVKLVVANERALDAGVRYVDADLNRSFADDVPADAHERVLAERLADAVRGCTVLAVHSTQSHAAPFAISSGVDAPVPSLVPALSVEALVDTGDFGAGRLFATEADILEVEAGLQGSETAAENAVELVREFLAATGVLADSDEPAPSREVPVFEMGESIPKPPAETYEVFAENFQEVAAGDTYAAADGEPLVADEAFWPVLLSPYGYAHQFGYRGEPAGVLQSSADGANSTSVSSLSSAQ